MNERPYRPIRSYMLRQRRRIRRNLVAALHAAGCTDEEISLYLMVTIRTVRTYRRNLGLDVNRKVRGH